MNPDLKGLNEEDWPDPGELATETTPANPQYVPKHGVKSFCCGAAICFAPEWLGWKCAKCGAIQTLNPDTGILISKVPLPWNAVVFLMRTWLLQPKRHRRISEMPPSQSEGEESSQHSKGGISVL